MTFDKKIIVFEDIDCIGDIILERKNQQKSTNVVNTTNATNLQGLIKTENDSVKVSDVLQTICDINGSMNSPINNGEQPITLDDILNLWDGIRETPGRVLVITSNHYDKLDKALKRPGRIDISLELSYASHQVISDMYFHFFGKKIDDRLQQIKPHFYTPSEITNMYRSSRLDEEFIARLLKNEKVE
jgi:SpoVK/Ycf46/Vps4 family AAA+-type ATPase